MVYELRTYRIPEGRMSDILNRFEHITLNLFERHGIEVVGFWTRADANELVYICKFESEAAMETAWAAFRADPEWLQARERTEANGPIVEEVISHLLNPTSFSPMGD
jgi:heme-degrading monooxygenase HmoA